jgi:hypothetical protein
MHIYAYTYSVSILSIEFHADRMQTNTAEVTQKTTISTYISC